MGMSVGGDRKGVKSDINVTPLVDIVLVLLIIFLVLTPIKMRSLTIEVPRKLDQDTEFSELATKQITVLLRADQSIKISDGGEDTVIESMFDLSRVIRPMLEGRRTEKVVFVDFEDEVKYGDAVTMIDTIKGAGAEKVALKFRVEDEQPAQ